jgi:hypothetical protein
MISNDTLKRLIHAVTDSSVGNEIANRLAVVTPADAAAAQVALNSLNLSAKMKSEIEIRLFHALAGDDNGAAGKELAYKLINMIYVLQAQADGYEITNEAAEAILNLTADITLTNIAPSEIEEEDRNDATFTLQVLAAAANPTNTVLATFSGTSAATVLTITPNNGLNNPNAAASAVLDNS